MKNASNIVCLFVKSFIVVNLIFLYGCNEISDDLAESNVVMLSPFEKRLKFKYKDRIYTSDYTTGDTIIFSDKEAEILYNQLRNDQKSSLVVRNDGSVEFFDNLEDALSDNHTNTTSDDINISEIKAETLFCLSLYTKDSLCFEINETIKINKSVLFHKTYDLLKINKSFNNNIHAFDFSLINKIKSWPKSSVLKIVFFDESDFSGQTIVYIPDIQMPLEKMQIFKEPNLSKINWDNRISSFIVLMTTI